MEQFGKNVEQAIRLAQDLAAKTGVTVEEAISNILKVTAQLREEKRRR